MHYRGDEKQKFYGPAYNCDDLGKLGYTLNGYYIVNSYENVTNTKREVVLCRFKQSRLGEQGKEVTSLYNKSSL